MNAYDATGVPGASNVGRFQYTGQMWLAEAGLYHYKARAYHPGIGRFMQTDPIGFAGGMNLYGYVGNDPVNLSDPSGLFCLGSHIGVQGGSICQASDPSYMSGDSSRQNGGQASGGLPYYLNLPGSKPPPTTGSLSKFAAKPQACTDPTVDCIVVTAMRTRQFTNGDQIKFYGATEQPFLVSMAGIFPLPGNMYIPIIQECEDESTRDGAEVNLAGFGGNLGGHTHLSTGERIPGPEDGVLAKNLGTAYVMTPNRVFRIDYADGQYSVDLLAGSLLSSEWNSIGQRIQVWSANEGGSGLQCSTTPVH